MKQKFSYQQIVTLVLLLVGAMLFSLIVYSLYSQPIYIWDEAIYANNSLDMASHRSYLTYTVNNVIDHYNTKPPLVLWLQACCFHLFSYTEFALRLPTLAALCGILMLTYRFLHKNQWSLFLFALFAFILLSTAGVVRPHVFLSGDLDAVLVFFTTTIVLIHLQQVITQQVNSTSIIQLILTFTLGYFTKSVAVFLIIPSLCLSYLYAGLLKKLLQQKSLYISSGIMFGIIVLYYFIREQADPGYFQVVIQSEFLRFNHNVMSWHTQPFNFYFKNIAERFNTYYLLLTAILSIPFFKYGQLIHKKSVTHLMLIMIIYLLTISIPEVKLEWYDAPIYPLWALLLAIMTYELYSILINKYHTYKMMISISLLLLFAYPAFHIYHIHLSGHRILHEQEQEAALLKKIETESPLSSYTVLMDVEDNKMHLFDALNFYIHAYKLNQQKTVNLKRSIFEVKLNDTLLVTQPRKLDSLQHTFNIRTFNPQFPQLLIIESLKQ